MSKANVFVLIVLGITVAVGQWVEKTIWLPDSLSGVVAPTCAAYSPAQKKLYVSGKYPVPHLESLESYWVVVIDAQSGRRIARVPILGGVRAMCYSPNTDEVYCAIQKKDAVEVIDCATDKVVTSISVGTEPVALCYANAEERVFISCFGSDSVCVIDCATTQVIAKIPAGNAPYDLCYSSGSNKVYCNNNNTPQELVVIDAHSCVVLGTVGGPGVLCYNPVRNKLYNYHFSNFEVIDCATDSIIAEINVRGISNIDYSPLVDAVYASWGEDSICVIDCGLDSIITRIYLGSNVELDGGLCCNPRQPEVYCLGVFVEPFSSWLWVVDAVSNQVKDSIPLWEPDVWSIMMCAPDGSTLFKINEESDDVIIIDCGRDTVMATVSVGSRPSELCYAHPLGKVYCTEHSHGTVSAINVRQGRVVANIRVGLGPYHLCYNSAQNTVYCSDSASGTVTVIDCGTDSVIAMVPVGGWPGDICYSPFSNLVFCANDYTTFPSYLSWVTVIACNSNIIIDSIVLGRSGNPLRLLYNSACDKIYVWDKGYIWDTLTYVIDCRSHRLLYKKDYGIPLGYNPGENKLYACNWQAKDIQWIEVRDGCADSVVLAHVYSGVGSWTSWCYNSINSKMYFSSEEWGGTKVVVVDGKGDSTLAVLRFGIDPWTLYYDPNGNKVYCADIAETYQFVTVIDGHTDSIIATVPVDHKPLTLIGTGNLGRVFVTNYLSGSVSVLRDSTVGVEEQHPDRAKWLGPTVVTRFVEWRGSQPASVFDISGRKLTDLTLGLNDIGHLAPGVYFVTLERRGCLKLLVVR